MLVMVVLAVIVIHIVENISKYKGANLTLLPTTMEQAL